MEDGPVFTALSTSARQLYLLLRCISFVPKAEVQITSAGLQFSAEEARVVQGNVVLEKELFSSYVFNPPTDQSSVPIFQVSLSALLETLQIFGISESSSSYRLQHGGFSSSYAAAFNTPALALGGTCKISYPQIGAPLSITISEAGVTTTCNLTTYQPASNYEDGDDGRIPLDKKALTLRTIMRSAWLHDAIAELSGTHPTVLVVNFSNNSAPYFALEGRGGPFGDSTVDFTPDSKSNQTTSSTHGKKQPLVAESFIVMPPPSSGGRVKQRYRFELVKKAGRAMALASKVSVRQDQQGVLSMQFLIELGDGGSGGPRETNGGTGGGALNGTAAGKRTFVDFRFVPLVDEEDDEEDSESAGSVDQ